MRFTKAGRDEGDDAAPDEVLWAPADTFGERRADVHDAVGVVRGDDTAFRPGDGATLAAGLEVLGVGTYKSALDAATAGKLGAVPPAVATYVKTAMGHHQEHLDAWTRSPLRAEPRSRRPTPS